MLAAIHCDHYGFYLMYNIFMLKLKSYASEFAGDRKSFIPKELRALGSPSPLQIYQVPRIAKLTQEVLVRACKGYVGICTKSSGEKLIHEIASWIKIQGSGLFLCTLAAGCFQSGSVGFMCLGCNQAFHIIPPISCFRSELSSTSLLNLNSGYTS